MTRFPGSDTGLTGGHRGGGVSDSLQGWLEVVRGDPEVVPPPPGAVRGLLCFVGVRGKKGEGVMDGRRLRQRAKTLKTHIQEYGVSSSEAPWAVNGAPRGTPRIREGSSSWFDSHY
ncbi:hypothetical protein EYF80_045690 [Liparis tanakae]|uniref:Uncharacterized protein n=1 Tax=Liparis tanakae TaxID=230148 RepID=A0A4Z2FTK8_9TELE|nr:hypothetical protein EYF80_045690 [Liparis tanakae]